MTRPEPDTAYFVTTFNWSGDPTGLILGGELRVDDGCVIFINGEEAYRFNIGADGDPIPFATNGAGTYADGANPGGEPVIQTIEFPGTNVVDGVNTIAVVLVQASNGSSDAVFGLTLSGDISSAPVNNDPTLPVDATVEEGRSYTMSADFVGLPAPTLQWFKDGIEIPGETNPTYTIPSMTAADAGDYFCRASNTAGSVDTRTAAIAFDPDTTGPDLISGLVLSDGTIQIGFNEAMTDFVDVFGVQIYPDGGDPFLDDLLSSTFTINATGDGFVLTTDIAPTPGVNYLIDINAGAVLDSFSNPNVDIFGFALGTEFQAVAFDSFWSFLDDGSDQGTAWQAAAFDDSSWVSGPGALGVEANLTPATPPLPSIQTPFLNPGNGGPTTVYLRNKFTLPGPASSVVSAELSSVFDDGVVVYLNEVEIFRQGVAQGHDFTTLATSHEANEIVVSDVDLSAFVDGENTLAVEVHQTSTGSSDAVWAGQLDLGIGSIMTSAPTITTQPMAPAPPVNEGDTVSLSVSATGFPIPTYQWQKDGVDIPGETGTTLNLPNVDSAKDDGVYRVIVSNGIAPDATSDEITIAVLDDVIRPTLVDGCSLRDGISIELTFSETIDQTTAEDVFNYTVELVGGGGEVVVTNVIYNGDSVILETEPRAVDNYQVTITGLTDDSVAANLIDPDPTVFELPSEVVVVDADDVTLWRYLDDGSDQGTAWRDVAFDDSLWPTGAAAHYFRDPEGNNEVPTRTQLSPTNSLGDAIITYYFRLKFDFPYDPATTPVQLQYMIDDGAVFYMNGTEVHRVGMNPTNEIFYTNFATRTQGTDQVLEAPVDIDTSSMVMGENTLAVEVHQTNLTSSDRAHATLVLAKVGGITPIPEITSITVDASGDLILEFTQSGAVTVEEAPALLEPGATSAWTPVAGGPHSSPLNVGPATGQRYFRLTQP